MGEARRKVLLDSQQWLETGNPFREVEEILSSGALHEKEKRRSDKKETQLKLF